MSHRNPATIAIIGVVVAVLAVSGALAMYGLAPSAPGLSTTSVVGVTTVTSSSSNNQSVLPAPIPSPTHGWINYSFPSPNGQPPILFGTYQYGDGVPISPDTWVGNLTQNANGTHGIYLTVTVPANSFVAESFHIGPSTFFVNSVSVPVSFPINARPNVTVFVYVNGVLISNGSRDYAPNGPPSNTPEYATNAFSFLHQILAGSVVTIGFIADLPVGIFPIQNIPGSAVSIANVTSVPSNLSGLPNNAQTTLPVFFALGS